MKDSKDTPRSEADAELEREIRKGRKFTMEEAIGRLAGPGAMKGASPVSRVQQAETEIETWLKGHLADSAGALPELLHRRLKGSLLLLENLDQPLVAVAACCKQVLDSENQLKELVREADVEWGRMMGERPFFNKDGVSPHPDDPYTNDSVRKALDDAVAQISAAADSNSASGTT